MNPKKLIPLFFHTQTTYLLVLYFVLSSLSAFATNEDQRIKSTITGVTVYPNQAQITRKADVTLSSGITKLIFSDLSPYINPNSIQVRTEQNTSLVSVSHRTSTLENPLKPDFIKDLEDSLESVNDLLMQSKIKRDALATEKEVLLANKQMGGTAAVVHADDLEETLALFRKRSQEIGEEMYKLSRSEKPWLLIHQKIKKQLDEYNSRHTNPAELMITLESSTSGNTTHLEFSYIVGNCTWNPFYDLRIKDMHSPLQLISKANITQNTGEDWENVSIRLSTADPNESGTKPELGVIRIGFMEPVSNMPMRAMMKDMARPASAEPPAMYSAGVAEMQQMATHIEFAVNLPYSIPADNNPHQVDLTSSEIPAVYGYAAVPKIEAAVFATAKIPAINLADQMPGMANIYFNGSFTGQTFIQPTTEDSLLISLGKDKRIQIERVLLKDYSSKSCFGSTKTAVNTWEIRIRNTRKEKLDLVLEDQIPVSDNKEIEVKLLESAGAKVDETTGKMVWNLTLDAEKSVNTKFSFEVKYPKNKLVTPY